MEMLALLFPGQGAQYVGMGKDFFEAYPVCRHTFQEADEILGCHLSRIIFDGPEAELTETKNSQPAIFTMSLALLRLVQQQFPSLSPKIAAGLSLGEYSALCAAGVLSFEETLKLVAARAAFMNEACEMSRGTMAVILGLEPEAVESIVLDNLWVANYNCPGQIVISGSIEAIEKASVIAKEKGAKRVLPLSVHGAFHSGLMKPAEVRLAAKIAEASFQEPKLSLIMNVPGDFVDDLDAIKHNLTEQLTHSVRWQQGILAAEKKKSPTLYLELGPGKTLAGMNKKIGVTAPTISLEKVTDLELLHAVEK